MVLKLRDERRHRLLAVKHPDTGSPLSSQAL
jgi:hypothetical protein